MHEHVGLLRKRSVWRSRSAAAPCLILPDGLEPPTPVAKPIGQLPPLASAESPRPGGRIIGAAITPRLASTCFRTASPDPGLLFIPNQQRQIASKMSWARARSPCATRVVTGHHHLGIAEAGHCAISAARQFLRQEHSRRCRTKLKSGAGPRLSAIRIAVIFARPGSLRASASPFREYPRRSGR